MKLYALSILILTTACTKAAQNTDEAFLNGNKSGAKVITENAPKTETEQAAALVQSIQISSADWDKTTLRVKQCEAELATESARMQLEVDGAASKGRLECLKNLDDLVSTKAGVALKETEALVDDFRNELGKYKFQYALINGDCIAKMNDGHLRTVRVKGDACLSVPFIKTGTSDGEVKGIEGAVSADAMASGILFLTCDVGRAHIRMSNTPCGSQKGSTMKSSFDPL